MSTIILAHYKQALRHQYSVSNSADVLVDTQGYFIARNLDAMAAAKQQQINKRILIAIWVAIVIVLHYAIWFISSYFPTQPLAEKKPQPVVIEIIKPKEEPPKVIEPIIPPITQKPKVPPISEKPKLVEKPAVTKAQPTEQPKAVQKPLLQAQPQAQPTTQTTAPIVTQPVASEKSAPVLAQKPATENVSVTEAKGYAGYLSNPAPEYPEVALERGWAGSVMLRVKVSASGSPTEVNIKQGSGKKVLDDAAVRTVKRWKFSPAMRGSTATEGWVDVPIHYQLPK